MTHALISREGLELLKQKLISLKNEYTKLRHKLVEARQLKDADEFDLVDEMTELALLEKQIADTEYTVAHSNPHDTRQNDDTVQLGSTVHLETPEGKLLCKVVSAIEADPAAGKISDASPLGLALIGKAAKALVHVHGPRRTFTYRVLGIGAT